MDEQVRMSERVALPDEILLKIVRACVEPFTLQVYEQTYNSKSLSEYFGVSHEKLYGDRVAIEGAAVSLVDHPTIIVIHNFSCTEPELQYLIKFPVYTNIKLVNKKFHDEVTLAMKDEYDGKLTIIGELEFFTTNRDQDWRSCDHIHDAANFAWLNELVVQFTLGTGFYEYWERIFNFNLYPRLRTITVSLGCTLESANEEKLLAGGHDEAILESLDSDLEDVKDWLDFKIVHERKIGFVVRMSVFVENLEGWEVVVKAYFGFQIEVGVFDRPHRIKSRELWSRGYSGDFRPPHETIQLSP